MVAGSSKTGQRRRSGQCGGHCRDGRAAVGTGRPLGPDRHCRRLCRHRLHGQWHLPDATLAIVAASAGVYRLAIIAGRPVAAAVGLLDSPPLPTLSPQHWLGYSYLSVFGALLAYGLWFRGIARLAPVAVSSLGLLSPLVAVLLGWLLLDQRLTGIALLGLVAVLGSILTVQWASRAPARAHT
ncbi:EamA family transporter [Pseudomonas sp.]|uniref:EamA family transporter n=1 Tax=Pseudomonas sp. TaxID=306 RepID=UPI0037CB6F5B